MKKLQKIIEWLFYAFIFLLPWQTRWIFEPGVWRGEYLEYQTRSLYATQILLFILIAASLIYFFKNGGLNKISKKIKIKKTLIATVIVTLALATNIYFSQNQSYSFYKLTILGSTLAFSLLIIYLPFNKKKFCWAVISAGLIQGALAINQFFNQTVSANKWLGMAAQNPQTLGVSVVETSAGRTLRAFGALPHPNILAGFLVIVLLFVVWQYFEESVKNKKNILLASFITIFTALLVTFSRAAWLAFAISLIFALVMLARKNESWLKHKTSINKITVALLFITLAFSVAKSDLVMTRLKIDQRLEIKSVNERISGYNDSWEIFKSSTWFGAGLGDYTVSLSKIHPDWRAFELQPVHNSLLLAIIELGAITFATIIILIALPMKKTFSKIKKRLEETDIVFPLAMIIALGVIGLFDHFLWSLYFGNLLLVFSTLLIKDTSQEKDTL
ncbi:MAG TPA: O-antigen ligase family protein [Candidatus Bipolaricaulota bacterium]|nr:O-antigen ligase family protein [Candidatus Bipolaricaulota bacterium]